MKHRTGFNSCLALNTFGRVFVLFLGNKPPPDLVYPFPMCRTGTVTILLTGFLLGCELGKGQSKPYTLKVCTEIVLINCSMAAK